MYDVIRIDESKYVARFNTFAEALEYVGVIRERCKRTSHTYPRLGMKSNGGRTFVSINW